MTLVTSNAPDGTPTWMELGIPDIERAKAFYGALFGWEFQDNGPESGYYTMCLLRGEPVAAMMPNPDQEATDFWWGVSFAAADCDGTAKRAADAGGETVHPPMDVMDLGRMAVLKDPQGGQFSLWQGRSHTGARIVNEPGSFVWHDLFTPDTGAAREFYGAALGLRSERLPDHSGGDVDYTTLQRPDDRYIGGIMGEPGAPRASWVTYFAVEDADEAVRLVREGGGTVEEDPFDSPYGRIAAIRDPFGAPLRVMKPAPEPQG